MGQPRHKIFSLTGNLIPLIHTVLQPQQRSDPRQQLIKLHGFPNKIIRPNIQTPRHTHLVIGCGEQNWNERQRRILPNPSGDLIAIHDRHHYIEQD